MTWVRALFLITVLVVTPGYRLHCYIFCTDQTEIQDDYTNRRDHCREYAQLKAEFNGETGASDNTNHKTELVNLFSECMAKNGWSVPDGKGVGKAAAGAVPAAGAAAGAGAAAVGAAGATAATAGAAAAVSPAPAVNTAAEDKASLSRTAECAFARQSADVSGIAAARAKACDTECAERLEAAPEAPYPAACPPKPTPNLAHGRERS